MNYSEIRFFILNNKGSISKEEIKNELIKKGVDSAEIDYIISKVYISGVDKRSWFFIFFFIFLLFAFILGFFNGSFDFKDSKNSLYLNKDEGEFNSGLNRVELGVYGVSDGEITKNDNDYFSFKLKMKDNYKSISIKDLKLRLISRETAVDYTIDGVGVDDTFKLKNIRGNIVDGQINPGDYFYLEFYTGVNIGEDEIFDILFFENDKIFDMITITTPFKMKTHYLILR